MLTHGLPSHRRDRPRLPGPERRQQIIDVTTSLISERGFWGLSMQDVADRCGITVPGLLHHFDSKSTLLIALLEHRDGITPDIRDNPWTDIEPPPGITFREYCAETMRRNATQPEIVRLFTILQAQALEPSHPAHQYFMNRQQWVLTKFARFARDDDAERSWPPARRVMAMMDGLQLLWLRSPKTIDLAREWDATAVALFGQAG